MKNSSSIGWFALSTATRLEEGAWLLFQHRAKIFIQIFHLVLVSLASHFRIPKIFRCELPSIWRKFLESNLRQARLMKECWRSIFLKHLLKPKSLRRHRVDSLMEDPLFLRAFFVIKEFVRVLISLLICFHDTLKSNRWSPVSLMRRL